MTWVTDKIGCLLHWIEGHPGTAAWVQAFGAILALAVAISVAWWQQSKARTAEQSAKAAELASLRLALHSEVKMVACQCLSLGDLLSADLRQENVQLLRLPPLTIFQANAGKIGLLTHDEIVHLVGFSGELFNLSVLANSMLEREMKGPGIREDSLNLKKIRSRACGHAAEFLATVPGIPGADQDQTHIATLRQAAAEHRPQAATTP
jgi:hypothetical protein